MDKGLILQPIKRHHYSELVVSLSVRLYSELGCGFRGVSKALCIVSQTLGWDFPSVPCHNSIENWVKKSGLALYQEPDQPLDPTDYALITDESMMIGSEKLMLTLGVKATKTDEQPLGHQHVQVLNISVKPSWNSQHIGQHLQEGIEKMQAAPRYIISDNCSAVAKAIRDTGLPHIRDVGHTLGMFLERIYKQDPEFLAYTKQLAQVRFQHIMNPAAYLLPPSQRTIARFLNLSAVVKWSGRIMDNFHKLTPAEQQILGFVPQNASLIEELTEVLGCVNQLQKQIKHHGICQQTLLHCRELIGQQLNCLNGRTLRLVEELRGYLSTEVGKMGAGDQAWNASSDVVESLFGTYKARKSPNKLYGVTSLVLILPLQTRIASTKALDFKVCLESVSMAQIKKWEKENLTQNLVTKRNNLLKCA